MKRYSSIGYCVSDFGRTHSPAFWTDTENNLIQDIASYHDKGYSHAIVVDHVNGFIYLLYSDDLGFINSCYQSHALGVAYAYLRADVERVD